MPVGSSGFGRVSSSMHGPVQVGDRDAEVALELVERAVDVDARVRAGRRDFHTGIGEPQKRLRVIDQSRAFASHLPN